MTESYLSNSSFPSARTTWHMAGGLGMMDPFVNVRIRGCWIYAGHCVACLRLFIAWMDFLSFRLISSSEEAEERQKGLSKNGGSASSTTDHPRPSLKQNGVIYHLILINQFGLQYYSNWIHACTGSEMDAGKCFIEPNWKRRLLCRSKQMLYEQIQFYPPFLAV